MSSAHRKSHPAMLGLFVVIGLIVLFVAVVTLAGGRLLVHKQKVVMHYAGSVYGLQVGAPVVFRGVRLGSVSAIGVAYDADTRNVTIPVTAELDREMVASITGHKADAGGENVLPALVQRGLRAQLATQSLLTGQLYVDLDFRPEKPAHYISEDTQSEIPTIATAFQELRNQVDNLDLRRLVDDVSAIASSTRRMVSGPEANHVLKNLEVATDNLRRVSNTLDKRLNPLLDSAQDTLATTKLSMQRVGEAANSVKGTSQRVGANFGPDSPLMQNLTRSADELSRSAAALRDAVGDDSPMNQNLQRALHDVSQAARELRELANTLDEQPESVIKGRR